MTTLAKILVPEALTSTTAIHDGVDAQAWGESIFYWHEVVCQKVWKEEIGEEHLDLIIRNCEGEYDHVLARNYGPFGWAVEDTLKPLDGFNKVVENRGDPEVVYTN